MTTEDAPSTKHAVVNSNKKKEEEAKQKVPGCKIPHVQRLGLVSPLKCIHKHMKNLTVHVKAVQYFVESTQRINYQKGDQKKMTYSLLK